MNNRWRKSVTALVVVATAIRVWWADLATIFPDAFAIRGMPTVVSTALNAISGLALPLAVIWGLVYLLILDGRLKRLLRDHKELAGRYAEAAEKERIRIAGISSPVFRKVLGYPEQTFGDFAETLKARGHLDDVFNPPPPPQASKESN